MQFNTKNIGDPAGARPRILRLTLILASLTAFAPFATDMYLASFPLLAGSFNADVGSIQLSLSVFFLGLALGQLVYGPLIDRFGRKPPLLFGVGLFVITSLLIAVAPSIEIFIGLRFLQAMGGSAGMIVSRAMIADLFSEREVARVLSLMMVVQGLAPILAPILGGYTIAMAGWEAVFLFLALFGLACLMAAGWGLTETLPPHQRRREHLVHVLTIWRQLLATHDFIVPTLTGALASAGTFAFISGSPFVYMELHGVSQQHYGWLFGLNVVGMILAAQLNRLLLTRYTLRVILGAGLAVMVLASAILVLLSGTTSLPLFVALIFVSLANIPLIGANATALAMVASGAHRGSGSAIIGVLQFGIASLVSATVSLLHDGTARPMTAVILACAATAGLVWLATAKSRR